MFAIERRLCLFNDMGEPCELLLPIDVIVFLMGLVFESEFRLDGDQQVSPVSELSSVLHILYAR